MFPDFMEIGDLYVINIIDHIYLTVIHTVTTSLVTVIYKFYESKILTQYVVVYSYAEEHTPLHGKCSVGCCKGR